MDPTTFNSSKGPTSQPTGLTRSHGYCQKLQDTPRDPVSTSSRVRTNQIHSRASMDWTWGPTSPGCCHELTSLSLKGFCSVDGRIFIRGIRFKTPAKEHTGRMLSPVYIEEIFCVIHVYVWVVVAKHIMCQTVGYRMKYQWIYSAYFLVDYTWFW